MSTYFAILVAGLAGAGCDARAGGAGVRRALAGLADFFGGMGGEAPIAPLVFFSAPLLASR